jgi:hypothetical protein
MRMKRARLIISIAVVGLILLILGWELFSAYGPSPWRETGHLLWPRTRHQALLLQDGRVLVIGGLSAKDTPVLDCETFDPKTELWSPAGRLEAAPDSGVLLADGQVLVTESTESGDPCQLFDPKTNKWSSAPDSPSPAVSFFVPMPDGRFLGYFAEGDSSIYDPKSRKWKLCGDSEMACTGLCLPDGRVLAICGENIAASPSHFFDPKSETWTDLPPHDFSPYGQAFLLQDGRVFYLDTVGIVGNILEVKTVSWHPCATARVYSDGDYGPASSTDPWEMSLGVAAALLKSGRIVVTGGEYDEWDPMAAGPPASWDLPTWWEYVRSACRRAVVPDCEVFDPASEKWSRIGRLREARRNHSATVLNDGRVLIVGGEVDVNHPVGLGSCELGTVEERKY